VNETQSLISTNSREECFWRSDCYSHLLSPISS